MCEVSPLLWYGIGQKVGSTGRIISSASNACYLDACAAQEKIDRVAEAVGTMNLPGPHLKTVQGSLYGEPDLSVLAVCGVLPAIKL